MLHGAVGAVLVLRHGRSVQVDPIKHTLKSPGTKHLKLKTETLLSNFDFKFNLRCYAMRALLVLFMRDVLLSRGEWRDVVGRGLHSSTFQLNLSALYGIGGARSGCAARVEGVFGGVQGVRVSVSPW